MKTSLKYMVVLFLLFFGITNCFAVSIKNTGEITGSNYSCNGTNSKIFKLADYNGNLGYYLTSCSENFPCTDEECLGNNYEYTETKKCYVTCDDYSSSTEILANQTNIWNNLNNYAETECEGNKISTDNLQKAITKLYENNTCNSQSKFSALKEYSNSDSGSKIVEIMDTDVCEPKIVIKKYCDGFSSTEKFKIKVGSKIIELKCGDTSEEITGFSAGDNVTITEMDSDGYVVVMSPKANDYTYDNSITVEAINGTITVAITNHLGKVNLTKTNAYNNAPMSGMTFALEKLSSGNWVDATYVNGEKIANKTTDQNGQLTFENLPKGRYRIVEISSSDDNKVVSATDEFEINKDVTEVTIKKTNAPFKIKILKIDQKGNSLKDSKFTIEIKGEDGVYQTISDLTLDENGTIMYLEKNGIYRITEIQAPLGYDVLSDSIEMQVKDGTITIISGDKNYVNFETENNVPTLKIINDLSKIKIYKRDSATSKMLAGATLVLTKSDGTIISEFKTSATESFAIALEPGNYILYEKSAPKNYETIKDRLEFIVKEDGTLQTSTNSVFYKLSDMEIQVYNVKPTIVPNTGIGTNILIIVGGLLLIGVGGYIIYKNVKTKETK